MSRADSECRELCISGRVQGVGFRPFIARLANQFGITGWVRNEGSFVRIIAQADPATLRAFQKAICAQAPAAATPAIDSVQYQRTQALADFQIIHSEPGTTETLPHLPLDLFTCPDCLRELLSRDNRRFRYPFINCTQCGPRYSLIERLPYDRAATSMSVFKQCPECQAEYDNPLDRRYHAEPNACPICGPKLTWTGPGTGDALALATDALRTGGVISVKGVGGFHLMTSAFNHVGIEQIRQLKGRPEKPLAVLFSDQPDHPAYYQRFVRSNSRVDALLTDPARPIVLVQAQGERVSPRIYPQLNRLGALLPYTPVHSLLLAKLDCPLVVTSANHSHEPICITDAQISRLTELPSLTHNRDIVYPADDSVFLASGLPVRLGRGHTPKTLALPFTVAAPLVGLGAQDKLTFALARNNQLVLSPHLGSLQSPSGEEQAKLTLTHLSKLMAIDEPTYIVDQHPQYPQQRFLAKHQLAAHVQVQHHQAHASALWLDAWQQGKVTLSSKLLVFTWDGTGYGEDGHFWGGETWYGRPGQWQRVGTLLPFWLAGGDQCIPEPWRVALAMHSQATFRTVPHALRHSMSQLLIYKRGCVQSSSIGRLLDACAALLGIETSSFDAFGAMQLNDLAEGYSAPPITLPWHTNTIGLKTLDWQPLIHHLAQSSENRHQAASTVFTSLNASIRDFVNNWPKPIAGVGFTGGVFQSERLVELLQTAHHKHPFLFHQHLPANDAAISVGQIIEVAGRTYGWQG